MVPLVEPRTERVWVRVDHEVDGGRSIVTEPRVWEDPRFTARVVGQAPLVPSQYVLVLLSLALDATYVWV